MADQHNPAAMLEAALNGTLTLDGEGTAQEPSGEQANDESTQDQEAQGAADDKGTQAGQPSTDDEPEGAPIASKSGAYTIPFEKLQQARDKAAALATENENLKQQLAALSANQQANLAAAQEQAQARADAGQGQTKADQNLQAAQAAIANGVDPSLFGDFTEEDLAKGVFQLVNNYGDTKFENIRAELRQEIAKELAPLREQRVKSAQDEHYGAIYAKHADADDIPESAEFQQWRNSLPSFMRAGVETALTQGSAQQVIEVFDSFKAQTGKQAPTPRQQMEVERRVPASLSEMAGAPPSDKAQQTLQMADNPSALLENMMSMTPEQIEAVMNRV